MVTSRRKRRHLTEKQKKYFGSTKERARAWELSERSKDFERGEKSEKHRKKHRSVKQKAHHLIHKVTLPITSHTSIPIIAKPMGGGSTGWGMSIGQPLIFDDKQTVALARALDAHVVPSELSASDYNFISNSNDNWLSANPDIASEIADPMSLYNQSYGGW